MTRALIVAIVFAVGCSSNKAPVAKPADMTLEKRGNETASPAQRYEAAKRELEAGHLDRAEMHFTYVVDSAPVAGEDPLLRVNALLGLASLHKERGDAKGALVFASKVMALRPDDGDALDVVVDIAHEAGDLQAEIAARESLVRLDPDALDERLALAGALTAAKDTDRAAKAYLGYEDARQRIVTALGKSHDPAMRRAAARALGAAHDAGTARALVYAMTDRDAGVRAEAVRSVAIVGLDLDAEIRPALRKMSESEHDPAVAAALREALALPAPAGQPTAPAHKAPAPSAK